MAVRAFDANGLMPSSTMSLISAPRVYAKCFPYTALQSNGNIVVVGSCGIEHYVNGLFITAARYAA